MASLYRHANSSATAAHSAGSRRLSAHNPFRQPAEVLANYRASGASSSTPTINEISERRTMSPEAFENWVAKNQELESLSDDDKSFNEDDLISESVFIRPQRPSIPQRAGSDSSVVIHQSYKNLNISSHLNRNS